MARPTSVEPVKAILLDLRMQTKSFTGRPVAGNDIHDAGGQARILANLRERQRSERSEFRGFQHHRVTRSQSRRNLPGQHEQRKIPRNDLTHDTASRVTRKFLRQYLRPTRVMIKMPRDQWDIDIAALANRFAVVHRLQHREPPRVFLHLPRQRIQITRARMP